MDRIILFDGICNFCNSSVQFVIKHDSEGGFKFASLQSGIGKELLRNYGIENAMDSFVFIDGGSYYTQSNAALMVCKYLNRPWNWMYIMRYIPRPARDALYRFIAKNRYKWFGKRESCIVPSENIRNRFLE